MKSSLWKVFIMVGRFVTDMKRRDSAPLPLWCCAHALMGTAKTAPGAPLEGLLVGIVVPDGGGAAAGEDVDHLLIEVAFGVGGAAWGDLDDVGVIDAAGAFQVDDGAVRALAAPGPHLNVLEVLNVEAGDDGNAFALLPFFVGFDALHLGRYEDSGVIGKTVERGHNAPPWLSCGPRGSAVREGARRVGAAASSGNRGIT